MGQAALGLKRISHLPVVLGAAAPVCLALSTALQRHFVLIRGLLLLLLFLPPPLPLVIICIVIVSFIVIIIITIIILIAIIPITAISIISI